MKRALITGITGQDGSYLADFLLDKGYEVHGIVRRATIEDERKLANIKHIRKDINLHICSLENSLNLIKVITDVKPDELYHLAASSFVSYSFEEEFSIINFNFTSTHYILATLKEFAPNCRIYYAGSSEMFGNVEISPQKEDTPFNPRSVYGISKLSSYHLMKNYREQYGLFACNGIMYNHESPRRGFQYVTRKITSSAARIKRNLQDSLYLGNIDAVRDWGYAPDYVEAMWLMLQQEQADDYIISTGRLHSVKEFLEIAFNYLDLNYEDYVKIDKKFYRSSEKIPLCGDYSKAFNLLEWKPQKNFKNMIIEMIEHDIKIINY
ncbi:MAG: GDP-mannose 4,6-dehydratase [Spirochaetota bacterium]|nr:GDP-mannose 4,6-dehydratase [Spirochaetota bacterium]